MATDQEKAAAEPRMSDEDYSMTQQHLMIAAQFVLRLNLPGFLRRIQDAAALCPLFDPTLWMRGAAKVEHVSQLACAANDFREEILRQLRATGKTDEEIERLVKG